MAKARRVRIIRFKWNRADWAIAKPWRYWPYVLMTEPGWHTHAFNIRPARIRSHRLEHLIAQGCDPETIQWPDYRKPHIYYW